MQESEAYEYPFTASYHSTLMHYMGSPGSSIRLFPTSQSIVIHWTRTDNESNPTRRIHSGKIILSCSISPQATWHQDIPAPRQRDLMPAGKKNLLQLFTTVSYCKYNACIPRAPLLVYLHVILTKRLFGVETTRDSPVSAQ